MAKGRKGGATAGGPKKKHGPKKRMFHCYSKCMRVEMAKHGMLKKEVDQEAMQQSLDAKKVAAKAKKNA